MSDQKAEEEFLRKLV